MSSEEDNLRAKVMAQFAAPTEEDKPSAEDPLRKSLSFEAEIVYAAIAGAMQPGDWASPLGALDGHVIYGDVVQLLKDAGVIFPPPTA